MNESRKSRARRQWLSHLSLPTLMALASAHIAQAQANPAAGLVLTPATFAVLNPSIFGDNAAVVIGANYGNRPAAKSYLFSGSLSHVRFEFGRTTWPFQPRVKSLTTSLDYAHGLVSARINPAVSLVSGVQGSVGYGLINYLNGTGTEGLVTGVLLAAGARFSGRDFQLTPYLSPAYFFARESLVGYNCVDPRDCQGLTANGFRFSFGGGLRLDLFDRISVEGGVRKTQTPDAISRRSFGLAYHFGGIDGRGLRDAGSFTLQMDNDFFARKSKLLDQDYTQGFHFTFNRKESPQFLENALGHLGNCETENGCLIQASTIYGQEIYTPQYYPSVAPGDRPFGGWLYGGVQSSAVSHGDLTTLSAKLGVTGPPSFAQQLQVTFHQLVPSYIVPQGWGNQLKFEPGIIVTAEKKDFSELRAGLASLALIKSGSASVGNILTDLEAGLSLRAGMNSEHPWMLEKHRGIGVHALFGVRGDLVLRNLFLDGNTFRSGPRVQHVPFVWQKEMGVGISIGSISLDYQQSVRSDEFTTGRRYHPYGTVSFTRRGQF